jgi:hypothetical protein
MKATEGAMPAVAAEEVERRLAEYRRLGFQRQAPAQVVYQGPAVACPWAGCDLHVAGINFQLERMGDQTQRTNWLTSWWKGSGLVGLCPRCRRPVLFNLRGKETTTAPGQTDVSILPENWYQMAILVTATG